MNTEKHLPRHPFHDGFCSTKSRADVRKNKLQAIGLGEAGGRDTSFTVAGDGSLTNPADLVLIERFVTGHATLSETLGLKIEIINGTRYLTTHDGMAIASINRSDDTPFSLLKRESPYWNLVNQALLQHQYMPLPWSWQQEFIRYEQQDLPDGYVMNFTQAGYLYQTWLQRQSALDLLLLTRGSWYPIRAVVEDQGTLTIQTLVAETTVESADWLIWLSTPEDQAILRPIHQAAVLEEIPAIAPDPAPPASPPRLRLVEPLSVDRDGIGRGAIAAGPELIQEIAVAENLSAVSPVISFRNGRLYIATVLGEVVVEGTDLQFWISQQAHQG